MKTYFSQVMLFLMIMIPFVQAGTRTKCLAAVSVSTATLVTGCAALTVGAGIMACTMGAGGLDSMARSNFCFHSLDKRNIVIEQPKNQKDRYSACMDFGEEYGFECIKPRHVKKLGEFMINTSCKNMKHSRVSKCISSKFFATCVGGEMNPQMCKTGFECQQQGNEAHCVPI